MPPTRNRGGFDWLAEACPGFGQPRFGLFSERRGWCRASVESVCRVYTLLLDIVAEPLSCDCLSCTNPERNGAALPFGIAGNVYPETTVARCLGSPLTRMRGLIHVTLLTSASGQTWTSLGLWCNRRCTLYRSGCGNQAGCRHTKSLCWISGPPERGFR